MEKAGKVSKHPEERFVLFADIMGFKDRVMQTDHDELKKALLAFKERWTKRMEPLEKGNHLRYSQFSDSIVVVADGVGDQQANLITKAAIILVQECLKAGFPLKGAIAQGQFTYDDGNQLFFGQPLVDAYLLQESVKYYGIVLHHTAEKQIMGCSDSRQHYAKLKAFMGNGRISHYQLCWQKVDLTLNDKKACDWLSWLDDIEQQVSGIPRIYVDNTRAILEEQEAQQKQREEPSRSSHNR